MPPCYALPNGRPCLAGLQGQNRLESGGSGDTLTRGVMPTNREQYFASAERARAEGHTRAPAYHRRASHMRTLRPTPGRADAGGPTSSFATLLRRLGEGAGAAGSAGGDGSALRSRR